MGLLFDHNKSCFWVSTGRPSLWNYIASGMIQYVFSKNPRKYYIVFEATEKATYPSGLFKKLFFKAQRVFEYDIELNEKNILHYEDGRNKKSSM